MIPKKIHQIWSGNKPIPDFCLEYSKQIKDIYPDYEHTLWLDDDLEKLKSCKFARHAKEYGDYDFLADWYRSIILYEHGGIYLDIDVQPKEKIDVMLLNEELILPLDSEYVTSNYIIGCNKKSKFIKNLCNLYTKSYTENYRIDRKIWSAPDVIRYCAKQTFGELSIIDKDNGKFNSNRIYFIDITNNKYFNHVVGMISKHFTE